ncbi:MAG: hypothetical protein O8C61_04990 [Candidatus Methanoperedens sp.]|nr:hypothetical protein [Candidatus Methanoperedens sp.]
MNSPEGLAEVLVGLSNVGFVVFFGVASFVPIVLEKSLFSRKQDSAELLFRFPYRLILRLGETTSIVLLIILSFLFILSGLFSLFYLVLNINILLVIAETLSLLIMLLAILFILYIVVCSMRTKDEELKLLIQYSINEQQKLKKKK